MANKKSGQMKNAPAAPMLPPLKSTSKPSDLRSFAISDEDKFGDLVIANCDLSGQNAGMVAILATRLNHVRAQQCTLNKLRISDLRFENCDLSNSEIEESKASRIELIETKFTGLKFVSSELSDLRIENCLGELAQFSGSKFKNTIFRNCNLKGADFRFCDLSGVQFRNCDLLDAEFYEAKLSGADFRSSSMSGIKARPADLKGLIIDSDQALELARFFATMLAIEVTDPGDYSDN